MKPKKTPDKEWIINLFELGATMKFIATETETPYSVVRKIIKEKFPENDLRQGGNHTAGEYRYE